MKLDFKSKKNGGFLKRINVFDLIGCFPSVTIATKIYEVKAKKKVKNQKYIFQ